MPALKYSKELLYSIIKRDKAILMSVYEHVNRETLINYKCNCGNQHTKKMRYIVENGGTLCNPCGKILAGQQRQTTMLNIYGVTNPLQNEEIMNKVKATNRQRFGCEFASQNASVKKKVKETNIIRFGVEHPLQHKQIMAQVKVTNIKKYGVESPTQNKEIQNKIKITNIQRYGVENPGQCELIKNKMKATNLIKFGVEYASQNTNIKNKVKATNIIRFGVEYASQNAEVMERTQKNAKKYKEFIMPSGTVRKVQGYEPFALRDLLKVFSEDQIKTDRKDVPRIQYEVNGTKRFHFPDIFIPHENKLIEIKSTWTLKCKADNILLKKKACEKEGFVYEIWCFNAKGNRVEIESEFSNEDNIIEHVID